MEIFQVDIFQAGDFFQSFPDPFLIEVNFIVIFQMTRANDFLLPALIIVSDQNRDGSISLSELHDVMAMYNWIPDDVR